MTIAFPCLKLPLIFPIAYVIKFKLSSKVHTVSSVSSHFPPFLLHLSLGTLSYNQSEFCTVSWKGHTLLSLHLLGCPPYDRPLPKSRILEHSSSAFLVPLRWSSPFSAFPSTLCRLVFYSTDHITLLLYTYISSTKLNSLRAETSFMYLCDP